MIDHYHNIPPPRVTRPKRQIFPTADSSPQSLSSSENTDKNIVEVEMNGNHQKIDVKIKIQTSDQIQSQILSSLSKINYSQKDGKKLQQIFQQKIKQHITIRGYRPQSKTIIGANVLTNGKFHEYWSYVLLKQKYLDVVRPKYYADYKQIIINNVQNFERAFRIGQKENSQFKNEKSRMKNDNDRQIKKEEIVNKNQQIDSKMEDQAHPSINNIQNEVLKILPRPQSSSYQKSPPLQFEQSQQQFIPQIELTPSFYNIKPVISSVNIITSPISSQQAEQDQFPASTKLLEYRQTNKQRISAQIVCSFLSIPEDHIYDMDQIKVQEVLQLCKQTKCQYAIILGRRIYKTTKRFKAIFQQYSSQESVREFCEKEYKVFISCYKYVNLEQLIRFECTYGKIFGFIAYDYRIDFLQEINKIKNFNNLRVKNSRNERKIQDMVVKSEESRGESKLNLKQDLETPFTILRNQRHGYK